ncbi:hypothetical protein PSMK_23690 [Phycisphaera mikurensis NBRC 102666]|uniref:PIN domain-containing protein n=1 Tax=Phycisphaera mikurensis (strain NBRC 102666 / KCTC 22515 / FYK2301M01) TaxID=1142394 RepID=I0IGZ0_PHYMF|nr:hypothetical protein [Phycisphaera mikurensis]BAM04528.1 hypothetical protein PSMK_23690 [Phycisphaera mikurensis NBRC 102666]
MSGGVLVDANVLIDLMQASGEPQAPSEAAIAGLIDADQA